jgi:predicted cupin superfamily sugar epimerase
MHPNRLAGEKGASALIYYFLERRDSSTVCDVEYNVPTHFFFGDGFFNSLYEEGSVGSV